MASPAADETVQTQKKQSEMLFVRGKPASHIICLRLALNNVQETPLCSSHLKPRRDGVFCRVTLSTRLSCEADAEHRIGRLLRAKNVVLLRESSRKMLGHDGQKHHLPMLACGGKTVTRKTYQRCEPDSYDGFRSRVRFGAGDSF